MPPHDPIVCLQRLRAHMREELDRAGWFDGSASDDKLLGYVCYFLAKAATDPDGLSLLTEEMSASDAQLQRRQTVPLATCSRADRLRMIDGGFAFVAQTFLPEIEALRHHLAPDEQPPLACVPRWIMDVFVRWPKGDTPIA